MKILHLPYHYFPELVGGTEVYVSGLIRETALLGIESAVAAPGSKDEHYTYENTPVYRFPVGPVHAARDLYGTGDSTTMPYVHRILDEVRPDIVHLHGNNRGLSLLLVAEAKRRGLKVVFTTHIPSAVCARGTLLRHGTVVCDGIWNLDRCTACTLQSKGAPAPLIPVLARLPLPVSEAAGALGRVGMAFQLRSLVALTRETTFTYYREADAVVAVCQWLRDMLVQYGVPEDKLLLSRQGVGVRTPIAIEPVPPPPYRFAYFGRLTLVKGVHTLLEAMRLLPKDTPIELDLFGTASEPPYQRRIDELLAGLTQVRVQPPLPPQEVVARLAGYHALLVPSTWLETGPLVVYEAAQARVPVIGSALGGIAELVKSEVDGLLVPPDNPAAWAAAFVRVVNEPGLLPRLRAAIQPPRTMAEAAAEMDALYRRLLGP